MPAGQIKLGGQTKTIVQSFFKTDSWMMNIHKVSEEVAVRLVGCSFGNESLSCVRKNHSEM